MLSIEAASRLAKAIEAESMRGCIEASRQHVEAGIEARIEASTRASIEATSRLHGG